MATRKQNPKKKTTKKKVKQDQLSIDVTGAVSGVDAVLSKIIKDRSVWKDFFKNPAKILAEMGYSKPPSDGDAQRYNQIFYALLTDNDLLSFVHGQEFCPQMSGKQVDAFHDNLQKTGAVQFDAEVDVDIIRRLLNNPPAFKKLMTLSLKSINKEGVFDKKYTDAEIGKCVKTIVANAKAGNSFSEMVEGLPWADDESGGLPHVMVVIPPAVAVPVVAEAVACGTVACVVVPMAKTGMAKQSLETLGASALQGDRDSMHALQTVGLLLEFISELTHHVKTFEKILRT